MLICAPAFLATRANGQVGRQRRQVVGGDVACSACTIELEKVVTLRAPGSTVGIDDAAVVARDSQGRYYVTESGRKRLLVFINAGGFIRTLGREGDGPGEFRRGWCRDWCHLSVGAFAEAGAQPASAYVIVCALRNVFHLATFRSLLMIPGGRPLRRSGGQPLRPVICFRAGRAVE